MFKNIQQALKQLAGRVYYKRNIGEELDIKDLIVLLADTILDQRFFKAPEWDGLYGGVRYIPYRQTDNPARILIIQWPAAIGDLAMTANFLGALRKLHPGSEICFLANNKASSIYGSANIVDYIIDNPLDSYLDQLIQGKVLDAKDLITSISKLVKTLTARAYDLAINLQILPQSAVLTRLAGARENLGMTLSRDGMPVIYGNIWFPYLFGVSSGLMRYFNRHHRTEIFSRFIDKTDGPSLLPSSLVTRKSIKNIQHLFDSKGIKHNDLVIGLNPMANWPSRIWPRFGGLARIIEKKYGARVIVFGSRDNHEKISNIITYSNSNAVKITHLELNEFMAALLRCDVFITNDTGPMHLACLLNRRTIALFGPTSIREVGPWNQRFVALQSGQCSGCFQYSCDRKDFCMEQISIKDVISAVDFFIHQKKNNHMVNSCSRLKWFLPDGRHNFPSPMDDAVSRLNLWLLENRYSNAVKKTIVAADIKLPGIEKKRLIKMFAVIRHAVEKTLEKIDNKNKEFLIKKTDDCLIQMGKYFKPIIVFNNMKFLDKRAEANGIETYKIYYSAILSDVEYCSSFLENLES